MNESMSLLRVEPLYGSGLHLHDLSFGATPVFIPLCDPIPARTPHKCPPSTIPSDEEGGRLGNYSFAKRRRLVSARWTSTSRTSPSASTARQVNHAPIDFQIDLVMMPDRMRFGTALAQFRCNDRPEMIYPASDCLVRNCNSAPREQILDVTKAEREPEIEPDRLVNDLRREPISGVADFRHALRNSGDGVDGAP